MGFFIALLGNLLLLFAIEINNDTYFFTNSDPHVLQQVIMLVRVLLCGIVAFGASTIVLEFRVPIEESEP
jgi:hypothetical protein